MLPALTALALAATLSAQDPAPDQVWSRVFTHGQGWETSVGLVPTAPDRAWSIVDAGGQLARIEIDLEGELVGGAPMGALSGAVPVRARPDGAGGALVAHVAPAASPFGGAEIGGLDLALSRHRADGSGWTARHGTTLEDLARDVRADGEGGAFLLGVTDLPATGLSSARRVACLVRVGSDGTQRWLRLFPFTAGTDDGFDASAMVVDTARREVLCVGSAITPSGALRAAACVVTFDGDAGPLRVIGTNGTTFAGAAPDGAGGFTAVGSHLGQRAALACSLDASGSAIGAPRLLLAPTAPWGATALEHAVSDGHGGVLALGRTSDHADPFVRPTATLVRLAADGTLLWRRDVDPSSVHASFPRDLQPWGAAAGVSLQSEAASDGASGSITLERLDARGVHDAGCSAAPHGGGRAARLLVGGSDLRSADAVLLDARDLPPAAFGIFVCARAGRAPGPGGLCLSGTIGRFVAPGEVWSADGGGRALLRIGLDRLPLGPGGVSASVGETWHFQGWFRDGASSAFTGSAALTLR